MTFKPDPGSSLMKRFSREPLVHFLLFGAILFGAYAYLGRKQAGADPSKQIELTVGDLSQLVQVFRSQWRRDPAPEEFRQLVEEKAREEILYREALALGLDKDDTIVKRRLAQKMQFLAEDVAAAREPTVEELTTWYQANRDRFAFPPRVSFRQLYFSADRRQAGAHADAAAALTRLAGQPEDSNLAANLADVSMFQDYYRDRTPEYLSKEFGPNFALAVTKGSRGAWQGPFESGFGWHLVFVDTLIPGRAPAFEEVEDEVKRAWLAEQKVQAWHKTYEDLRAKYTVLVPAPAGGESASGESSKPEPAPTSSGKGPS